VPLLQYPHMKVELWDPLVACRMRFAIFFVPCRAQQPAPAAPMGHAEREDPGTTGMKQHKHLPARLRRDMARHGAACMCGSTCQRMQTCPWERLYRVRAYNTAQVNTPIRKKHVTAPTKWLSQAACRKQQQSTSAHATLHENPQNNQELLRTSSRETSARASEHPHDAGCCTPCWPTQHATQLQANKPLHTLCAHPLTPRTTWRTSNTLPGQQSGGLYSCCNKRRMQCKSVLLAQLAECNTQQSTATYDDENVVTCLPAADKRSQAAQFDTGQPTTSVRESHTWGLEHVMAAAVCMLARPKNEELQCPATTVSRTRPL
jgi:hypothetical protein